MPNIITVHRPELTEAERTKRTAAIKAAAVRLLIATEQTKVHKNERK